MEEIAAVAIITALSVAVSFILLGRRGKIGRYPLGDAKIFIEFGEKAKNTEMIVREIAKVAERYASGDDALTVEIIDRCGNSEESKVCELLAVDYPFVKHTAQKEAAV